MPLTLSVHMGQRADVKQHDAGQEAHIGQMLLLVPMVRQHSTNPSYSEGSKVDSKARVQARQY